VETYKCEQCGEQKVTFYGEFHENVSMITKRKERTVEANLCYSCMTKIFLTFTGKTLVGTWWGVIGSWLGIIYIPMNVFWYIFNSIRFIYANIFKK